MAQAVDGGVSALANTWSTRWRNPVHADLAIQPLKSTRAAHLLTH